MREYAQQGPKWGGMWCFPIYTGLPGFDLTTSAKGGGSPKGLVPNLLMQFFTMGGSKNEISETCFFDIVTTQNDHPTYVLYFLGSIDVYFPLIGFWVQGGFLPTDWYTTAKCSFSP